ncbi:MAG: hypothetical protein JXR80_08865 [Deltaproteobacteria bacterium]|nr:hypothetical protein [Deltaproteobacteria bacterium]
MFDVNKPVSNMPVADIVVQSVSPRSQLSSGGRLLSKSLDFSGRVIQVRHGRQRSRRYSPIAYSGTNRRQPRDQRRMARSADAPGDRVVTLLVPAGAQLDSMIGREAFLKISD